MLVFQISKEQYEYDIRGLLMAFYPGVAIRKIEAEKNPSAADFLPKPGREGRPSPDLFFRFLFGERQFVIEAFAFEKGSGKEESSGKLVPVKEKTFEVSGEKKDEKSVLKRNLYRMLQSVTGQSLPWGTLTGIRPTKIATGMLEEGKTEEKVVSSMQETYLTSREKAELSVRISEREREILKAAPYEKGYSLYIGIPFCPTRCLYCSFTAYPASVWQSRMDEYVNALLKEMRAVSDLFRGVPLHTIYFGGGTPTTLSAEQLRRLLAAITETFDLSNLKELTVEAGRPDSITREKLAVCREYQVDRISINPQTMKEETLRIIGRDHTPEEIKEAMALARDLGFDNINMDLILGLPNESEEDVKNTMEEIGKLHPDSVTVHSLALKRAARLSMEREQYRDLSFENSYGRMDAASDACAKMGLFPYYLYRQKNMAGNFENTGFASPGKEGLYNILMIEEIQSIAAIGAGAKSKAVFPDGKICRAENVKDIESYLARTDEMIDRKRDLFAPLFGGLVH